MIFFMGLVKCFPAFEMPFGGNGRRSDFFVTPNTSAYGIEHIINTYSPVIELLII